MSTCYKSIFKLFLICSIKLQPREIEEASHLTTSTYAVCSGILWSFTQKQVSQYSLEFTLRRGGWGHRGSAVRQVNNVKILFLPICIRSTIPILKAALLSFSLYN